MQGLINININSKKLFSKSKIFVIVTYFMLLLTSCSLFPNGFGTNQSLTDDLLLGKWKLTTSDNGIQDLAYDIEILNDGTIQILDNSGPLIEKFNYKIIGSEKIIISALGIEKTLHYDVSDNDLRFYLDAGFNLYKRVNPMIVGELEGTESIQQSSPTATIITATPIVVTPSLETSITNNDICPDSWPRRISIEDYAEVCTKTDRLIIRNSPGKDGKEIARIYPGTMIKILDGPKCKEGAHWWKISVPEGTKVYYLSKDMNTTLNDDLIGWVQEGGDEEDEYFICKVGEKGN